MGCSPAYYPRETYLGAREASQRGSRIEFPASRKLSDTLQRQAGNPGGRRRVVDGRRKGGRQRTWVKCARGVGKEKEKDRSNARQRRRKKGKEGKREKGRKREKTRPVKVDKASAGTFCMRRTAPSFFFRPDSARNSIFVSARTGPEGTGAIQRPTTIQQCETTVHRTLVYARYHRSAISE